MGSCQQGVFEVLSTLDVVLIGAYLVFAFGVGVYFSRQASRSGESYFLADRSLPGWLVGLSIVATTFAADTPLAISGMVASKGIAANWFWWSMGIAHVGMFLFWAKLWRRADVVTDAELVEFRYGGASGSTLRSAKAIYFALVYNAIVLGWVISAMQKIAAPFVKWSDWLGTERWAVVVSVWPGDFLGGADEGLAIVVLVGLACTYSTLGGLRGVIFTDLIQLLLAGIGSIMLLVLGLREVGGLRGLREGLETTLSPFRVEEILHFVPPSEGLPFLSVQAFMVYLLIRWWASPTGDGGGYIAQRLMAARSPEDARQAAGVFVVLHYILRPWPWIVVGLVGLIVFPKGSEDSLYAVGSLVAEDREMAYPALASVVMGTGMLGLLLVSLLAAFMSTVDTHLNWGVSYVANDLWKAHIRRDASPRELVRVGRLASVVFACLALVAASQIGSVEKAWKFVAALGSGLGLPVLLRWLWWRTNAAAEIAGALGSFSVTLALYLWEGWRHPVLGLGRLPWEFEFLFAVVAGVAACLAAIWVYGAPGTDTLVRFYEAVQPPGRWGPIAAQSAVTGNRKQPLGITRLACAWLCGSAALVLGIFAPGHLLLGSGALAVGEFLAAGVLGALSIRIVRRRPRGGGSVTTPQ
jgi:SSS family solute:Na+ symporter